MTDNTQKLIALYLLFVLLSLTDLFFTSIIVGEDPTKEINPLAQSILSEGAGYLGLMSVKIQSFIVVGICIWMINKFRPVLARWVLYFGIATMLLLTFYHIYLCFVICYCDLVNSALALPS